MCGAMDHKRRDCPQKHSLPQRYVVCITHTEQRLSSETQPSSKVCCLHHSHRAETVLRNTAFLKGMLFASLTQSRDCPQKHSLPQRYVVCITHTEQRLSSETQPSSKVCCLHHSHRAETVLRNTAFLKGMLFASLTQSRDCPQKHSLSQRYVVCITHTEQRLSSETQPSTKVCCLHHSHRAETVLRNTAFHKGMLFASLTQSRDCPQKHSLPQRYVVCITHTEQRRLCQKPKLSMIQHVVATYMLGFGPTLTFLHSPILCRLYKCSWVRL